VYISAVAYDEEQAEDNKDCFKNWGNEFVEFVLPVFKRFFFFLGGGGWSIWGQSVMVYIKITCITIFWGRFLYS
jgi:hypothetical protein